MEHEFSITFRDMLPSDAVKFAIENRIEKLERFFDRIISCRVTVSAPHRHHSHGRVYHIDVQLKVPRKIIFVGHDREKNRAHEDIYVAIRDTFDAVDRSLENYVRKIRGVKSLRRDVFVPRQDVPSEWIMQDELVNM